jgi:hypothetical protein
MRSVFLSCTDTIYDYQFFFSKNKVVLNLDVKYELCLTVAFIQIHLPNIFYVNRNTKSSLNMFSNSGDVNVT